MYNVWDATGDIASCLIGQLNDNDKFATKSIYALRVSSEYERALTSQTYGESHDAELKLSFVYFYFLRGTWRVQSSSIVRMTRE
jgi:hypothetical protein